MPVQTGDVLLLKKEQVSTISPIENISTSLVSTNLQVIEKKHPQLSDVLAMYTTIVCQIRLYVKGKNEYVQTSKNTPDIIFLAADFGEYRELGFKPLRHIFWIGKANDKSLFDDELDTFVNELSILNKKQSDKITYVPSLMMAPRYFWSGSLGQFNLSCINTSRKLLVLDARDSKKIKFLPLIAGFLPERYSLWRALARVLLLFTILTFAGLFVVPKIIAKRSNYSVSELYKAYFVVLLLPSIFATILINFLAYRNYKFDIYSPDNPQIFEQRFLNALESMGIDAFWLHPDKSDTYEDSIFGIPYRAHTDPYPDLIRSCRGHLGFMGICHLDNCIAMPGGQWDVALKDFIKGGAGKAISCFADLNETTSQAIKTSEAVVWSKSRELSEVIRAIKEGNFYVRYNNSLQKLSLDKWQIGTSGTSGHIVQTLDDGVDIQISISSILDVEFSFFLFPFFGLI